jgi:hypothetical protein
MDRPNVDGEEKIGRKAKKLKRWQRKEAEEVAMERS